MMMMIIIIIIITFEKDMRELDPREACKYLGIEGPFPF